MTKSLKQFYYTISTIQYCATEQVSSLLTADTAPTQMSQKSH